MELHTIPAKSAVVMTVWKLPENTCTSESHMTPERYLREVCCSDDRKGAAQKNVLNGSHTKPHLMSCNGFAVVMVIV